MGIQLLMGDPPMCACGKVSKIYMAFTEGINHERVFFRCPNPAGAPTQCSFFQWAKYQPMEDLAAWKFMENEMGVRRAPRDIIKDMVQEVCQHERTTRNGTNQYYERVTCLVCGKLVSQQARAKAKAQAKPVSGVPAKAPPPTLASTATSSTRTRTAPSGARTYEEQ